MQLKHIRILSGTASLAILIALSGAMLASAANAPAISSVSPTSGATAGGTNVTITGTGFTGATAVDFGTTPGTITATTSDTSITATSPATSAAGMDDITVTTPNGASATSTSDQFTYLGAPTITSISPGTGAIAGGTSVMITGTGFTGATAVDFGGMPAVITASSSDTSITATSPATSTAGVEDITVTTPNGTSTINVNDQFTYNAPAVTIPVISNLMISNIGTSTATLTWNTDENATGQVFYGTSASYGSMSAMDTTPSSTHSITIGGLSEATLYHVDVTSGNAAGTATSSDMVFDTESTASTTPLAITGIDTLQSNATADGTFADGWQWVLHFVVPSVENIFSMKFADFTSPSSSSTIPAANDIEFYSPESANASSSASAILESGNNYGTDLTLTGDTSTSTPGRQIDVYVNVAVPFGTPTGTYSTTFGAMSTTTP